MFFSLVLRARAVVVVAVVGARVGVEAVALEHALERRAVYAEHARGGLLVAARAG